MAFGQELTVKLEVRSQKLEIRRETARSAGLQRRSLTKNAGSIRSTVCCSDGVSGP
jgi:hypothetical protein